jgi:nucleotide-binding universal stress UspA family protein
MTEMRTFTPRAVVVAVDGSDASRAALRWASSLGGPVRAVCSWTYPSSLPLPWSRVSAHIPEEVDASVLAELEHVVAEELGEAASIETAVLRGPAAGVLIDHAEWTGARQLVLGSRGLGGFGGLLLGSVSRHCLEYASCPVTVVPGPERAMTDPSGVSTIVVGLDGSPSSGRALDHAVEVAASAGAGIVAAHAFDPTFVELPPEVAAGLRASVERQVQDQCGRQLALPAVKDCRLLEGDARQVLLEVATQVGADLLVVGAVGAGTLHKALGPVATHLGLHASVPITVVR